MVNLYFFHSPHFQCFHCFSHSWNKLQLFWEYQGHWKWSFYPLSSFLRKLFIFSSTGKRVPLWVSVNKLLTLTWPLSLPAFLSEMALQFIPSSKFPESLSSLTWTSLTTSQLVFPAVASPLNNPLFIIWAPTTIWSWLKIFSCEQEKVQASRPKFKSLHHLTPSSLSNLTFLNEF